MSELYCTSTWYQLQRYQERVQYGTTHFLSKKCRGYENANAATIGEVPQVVFSSLLLLVDKFGGSSSSSNGIAKERRRVLTTPLKDMTNSQKNYIQCIMQRYNTD
jgi:hypothetical protein